MLTELKEIEKKALALPKAEKEVLIKNLINRLQDSTLSEIDQAWIEEAERRYESYKAGITKGIPGDQIFAEISQELGWQK
jgi:putative addiction module component (TIGR02574 family)